MPFFLPLLFIGATVAGGVTQAQAAKQQGKDQQAMMNYNARVKEEEAKAAEQKGTLESQRQAEAASRRQSSLEAELGGSGAVPTAGSPLLIQAKQASESELDNLIIGANTVNEMAGLRSQSQLDYAQGKMYRKAGNNAATATYMNTGTTVLGGLYQSGTFDNLNYKTSTKNPKYINQSYSNTRFT